MAQNSVFVGRADIFSSRALFFREPERLTLSCGLFSARAGRFPGSSVTVAARNSHFVRKRPAARATDIAHRTQNATLALKDR